ncbi:MAG: hypothetical protein DRQ44_15985 [Gammaproteobacteria bacterium]|nr:MAG: hypothetical protein DRQ44_15985 [Gammaproteobacteria bacterium]
MYLHITGRFALKKLTLKIIYTLLFSALATNAFAAKYNIAVQPVLPADQIKANYQPLSAYLSKKTGHEFNIVAYRNFLTYWIRMKRGKDIHFVLDAAHFTDFRVQRKDYTVLVKIPDTVSFTVVTNEENFVFDMEELISKRIATMASPGLGAIRLNEMFPNPLRLPLCIEASDSMDAVNKVLDGSVDAAIIPSPLVGRFDGLNSVISTEPVPHMALSSAPDVPEDVMLAVKKALLEAGNNPDGKKMLEGLNLSGFNDTSAEVYAGYADMLDGVFGY